METFSHNIFLIGFMGSGKTTISKLLAEKIGMEVVEMDETIVYREGMSIPDIFREKGEDYFRKRETELLSELTGSRNMVVSCGGGTPLRECNVTEMRKSGRIVWLTAAPETVLRRVKEDHSRPLLENRKDTESIRQMLEERREKYEAAADFTVATDDLDTVTICDIIIKKIKDMENESC